MKYLRWLVFAVIIVGFVIPMNVLVTLSTDEDQYRHFKSKTQDKLLNMLVSWAEGKKDHHNAYTSSKTLRA